MKNKQLTAQQLALFQQASKLQQSGQVIEAAVILKQLMQNFPKETQLCNQFGMQALQQGNFALGIELLTKSLSINPKQAEVALNCGIALALCNQFQQAITSFKQVLALKPNYPEAFYHLGKAHYELHQLPTALANFDQAIALKADYAAAYQVRAITLKHMQEYEAALASYNKAIELQPEFVQAHFNRGLLLQDMKQFQAALLSYDQAIALQTNFADAYNNRGLVLKELKQFQLALDSFAHSLVVNPHQPQVYYNRGLVFDELQDINNAIANYNHAIALQPNFAEAYNNRGLNLQTLDQYSSALGDFNISLSLKPDQAEVHLNRAICLKDLHQYEEALASCNTAIELKKDFAEAHWHKALLKLVTGHFLEGWQLYEWRWKCVKKEHFRNFPQPLWLGETPITNKKLLIHAEQGLGDFIQFCRYLPLLLEKGAELVVEVPAPLISLASSLKGQYLLVEQGSNLPSFDIHCPMMSLPLAFKTELATIPNAVPYLFVNREKQQLWRQLLGNTMRPKIGLVWSGSATDQKRSIPLQLLEPILSLAFEFHSLQKEIQAEDSQVLAKYSQLHCHANQLSDFSETAALIENLDLVITIDTSVAHLAGSLNKSVWILLRYNADYRWLVDRKDSLWYPSATLFRQPTSGDWQSVIAELSQKLQTKLLS